MFSRILAFSAIALVAVRAHMDVDQPPPLRGKNNPFYANGGNVDFDMTSPLKADGSNFPCKGYQTDIPSVSTSVATLVAGQPFTVSIGGSPSHGGGSCQFSLSYDGGKTFGVIHNEIGGCPLKPSYTFTVPANAPKGNDILLSWSWFNKIGNREMYQNCIAVDVNSTASAPVTLSRMFEANIFGGPCTTVEGDEVDFANPNVSDCPNRITLDTKVTIGGGAVGGPAQNPGQAPPTSSTPSKPTSSAPPATSSAPPAPAPPAPAPTQGGDGDNGETDGDCPGDDDSAGEDGQDEGCPSEDYPDEPSTSAPEPTQSTPVPAPAPAPSAPSTPSDNGNGSGNNTDGCTSGTILCSADGQSWSMCANGAYIKMGNVAPGMLCRDGQYVAAGAARRLKREYDLHARHRMSVRRLSRDH